MARLAWILVGAVGALGTSLEEALANVTSQVTGKFGNSFTLKLAETLKFSRVFTTFKWLSRGAVPWEPSEFRGSRRWFAKIISVSRRPPTRWKCWATYLNRATSFSLDFCPYLVSNSSRPKDFWKAILVPQTHFFLHFFYCIHFGQVVFETNFVDLIFSGVWRWCELHAGSLFSWHTNFAQRGGGKWNNGKNDDGAILCVCRLAVASKQKERIVKDP